MELSKISCVQISRNAIGKTSKFILAEISDGNKKILVLCSSDQEFHKEILHSLIAEMGRGFDAEPNGGGWIFIDLKAKKIWLWGESSAYGAPNYGQARKLLKENYKGFEILLEKAP